MVWCKLGELRDFIRCPSNTTKHPAAPLLQGDRRTEQQIQPKGLVAPHG